MSLRLEKLVNLTQITLATQSVFISSGLCAKIKVANSIGYENDERGNK